MRDMSAVNPRTLTNPGVKPDVYLWKRHVIITGVVITVLLLYGQERMFMNVQVLEENKEARIFTERLQF